MIQGLVPRFWASGLFQGLGFSGFGVFGFGDSTSGLGL